MEEIRKLIQEFLETQKTEREYEPRSIVRYEYILLVYNEFLVEEIKLNSNTLKAYLNGVTPKELFDGLSYYIRTRSITSEDTADLYISVIKTFFQFLRRTNYIESDALTATFGLSSQDPNSFNHCYDLFIKDLIDNKIILFKKTERALTEKEIKMIIDYCNECIDNFELKELLANKDKYNRFVFAIMIKLIIFCGVSERVLSKVKRRDINLVTGKIKINNMELQLPFNLRTQMKKYVDARDTRSAKENRLFVDFYGNNTDGRGRLGGFISNRLRTVKDLNKKSSVICVAKFAIIEMIRNGMNQNIIQSLTGFQNEVFAPCQEFVNLDKDEERSKYVNNKLKTLDLYDIL
jgi:integrase